METIFEFRWLPWTTLQACLLDSEFSANQFEAKLRRSCRSKGFGNKG